jgi:hypothetical protein
VAEKPLSCPAPGEVAELAEGAPLLREYGVKPIEGSNPSLSASSPSPTRSRNRALANETQTGGQRGS